MFKLKIIKTENDYQEAMSCLDELLDKDVLSHDERNMMELIAHLVGEYEKIKYPIALPSPIAAIKFRMEQSNIKQKDLIPFIGSRGKVSDILNGKRQLSLSMIKALHTNLNIPLEALMNSDKISNSEQDDDIEWNKFPIKAMCDQGKSDYFPNVKATCQQIKEHASEYLSQMIIPIKEMAFGNGFLRQNIRMGGRSDKYALAAWIAACYNKANQEVLPSFQAEKLELIINQLRALSILDDGPKQAVKFLGKVGIHVVLLKHLPKTHLDGAAFIADDKNPVIALTLRYDRIDYFWFTLFHELGHIKYHLFEEDKQNFFVDDLSLKSVESYEEQADTFASESLVTDAELEASGLIDDYSTEKVIEFAEQRFINKAIVAGRLRHKLDNYYILSNLIGNGCVRKMLME